MEFLIIWLITIILTKCIRTYHALTICKDIFSRGYKFSINQNLNPIDAIFEVNNGNLIKKILPYVPFFNLMDVVLDVMGYNLKKDYIISVLKEYELFEEMTQEEKNKFAERPTGIGALLMAIELEEIKKQKQEKIFLTKLEDNSEFFYQIDNEKEEIKIIKVTGNAKNLNEEEQIEKVVEECKTKVLQSINSVNTLEDYLNKITDPEKYEKVKKIIDKLTQSLPKEQQIELLNELKEEYIKMQNSFYDKVLQKTKEKRMK